MFESANYTETAEKTFSRTFPFHEPLVTTKVMLDEFQSERVLAIKIEFLGIERNTKHTILDPFNGGEVFKSKSGHVV